MNQSDYIASLEKYDNGYYQEKLQEGLEFQDVVTKALYQRGIVVVGYASRRFQVKEGENMLGAEIKYQARFREYGHLAIEVAEKSHPNNPDYVPSGIYRLDNSWLFVTGDLQTVYIFSTKYLRRLESRYKVYETPTSRGFSMPIKEAEKYCIRRIDLDQQIETGF